MITVLDLLLIVRLLRMAATAKTTTPSDGADPLNKTTDPSQPSSDAQPGRSGELILTPELAEYIADLLAELRDIARATGASALEQLLDVARREAVEPGAFRRRAGRG